MRSNARDRDLHRDEEVVDVAENAIVRRALIVMFEAHAEHVEKDADHDEYVEFLIGRHVEEESSQSELDEARGRIIGAYGKGVLEGVVRPWWASSCPFSSWHCSTSFDRRS